MFVPYAALVRLSFGSPSPYGPAKAPIQKREGGVPRCWGGFSTEAYKVLVSVRTAYRHREGETSNDSEKERNVVCAAWDLRRPSRTPLQGNRLLPRNRRGRIFTNQKIRHTSHKFILQSSPSLSSSRSFTAVRHEHPFTLRPRKRLFRPLLSRQRAKAQRKKVFPSWRAPRLCERPSLSSIPRLHGGDNGFLAGSKLAAELAEGRSET